MFNYDVPREAEDYIHRVPSTTTTRDLLLKHWSGDSLQMGFNDI